MPEMQLPDVEEFFKWSSDYSVNNDSIDEQHRKLVSILNRLFISVSRQEGDKIILATLDSLVEYTETHFASEEQLMQQAGYADVEAHKQEHRKLIEQLNLLRQKHALEEKHLYFELLGFLKTWLKKHILDVDMRYRPALQQAGFSAAAR